MHGGQTTQSPEGFKNSCTCTKASPAPSEESELLEGSSPSANPPLCCGHRTLLRCCCSFWEEQKRQQTRSLCGWWLPGTSWLQLPPPKTLTGTQRCSGSKVCGCRELAQKNRERFMVGSDPAVPAAPGEGSPHQQEQNQPWLESQPWCQHTLRAPAHLSLPAGVIAPTALTAKQLVNICKVPRT